jgi:hypothetical protein
MAAFKSSHRNLIADLFRVDATAVQIFGEPREGSIIVDTGISTTSQALPSLTGSLATFMANPADQLNSQADGQAFLTQYGITATTVQGLAPPPPVSSPPSTTLSGPGTSSGSGNTSTIAIAVGAGIGAVAVILALWVVYKKRPAAASGLKKAKDAAISLSESLRRQFPSWKAGDGEYSLSCVLKEPDYFFLSFVTPYSSYHRRRSRRGAGWPAGAR